MKAIGEKCGWVIPSKERRVLKLLRGHTRECEHEFVTKSPSVPRRKAAIKIQVEFAPEELSAFQPTVQFQSESETVSARVQPKQQTSGGHRKAKKPPNRC